MKMKTLLAYFHRVVVLGISISIFIKSQLSSNTGYELVNVITVNRSWIF